MSISICTANVNNEKNQGVTKQEAHHSNVAMMRFIVANRQHASTYSPVAFRSVHTGIEPPFLLKIYYAITACMTQGFTLRKY